jgi:hypothetical protein
MKESQTFSPFHSFTFSASGAELPVLRTRRPLLIGVHRPLLSETPAVSLACVCRFQLRLLSRRDEVSVFFQVFDYLFADNFALKTPKRALDRFIRIY